MNATFLKAASALTLSVALMAGCKSDQDKAIEEAKKQAAATGQAQQVITVDKNGTTTTTTINPPTQGKDVNSEMLNTVTAPSQTPPGTPPPAPGVYYHPTGTPKQQAANTNTGGSAFVPQSTGAPQPAAPDQTGAQQTAPGTPAGTAVAPVQPQEVNVPAGTALAIRINQRISVKTTPAGSQFTGELAEPYTDANGRVILPRRTPVTGVVEESHKRGRFKGASVLDLRLTSLTLNGQNYRIATHDVVRTKKGKGKRSAGFIGGGAGLGALIGGLAGGGKGALIGAGAGAGAGTAGAAFTGNRDLDIPAETVIRFRLADDLTLQS
jgi:hypothetical protein